MMNEMEEEIFMRPIQKQEVIKLLKQYHLLEEKNLKPLKLLADTDVIDIDLAAFYWNLLVNKDTSISSPKKSESILNKIEETFISDSDCDLDILESSDTLAIIKWSELIESKNDDQFEAFENTLMQLDDSLVASSWEKASLKIFEEYAKVVLHDKQIQEENFNESRQKGDNEKTEGINDALIQKEKNKMKNASDLDKKIKNLMDELNDEQKKKKVSNRTSLNANSVLNDTLEEIEVLMKCGESYMTRESIFRESFARSKSDDNIFERNKAKPISRNAERIYSKTPQVKKRKQTLKFTPSTCSSKILNNDSEFKIPKSRAPRRQIHSPIGDYIKNSPTTPLMKKVVSTPMTGPRKLIDNYREVLQENTNNTPIKLPTKTYKPAARALFVEKENEEKIPKNIKKLYNTPVPQIIKHLGRVPSSDIQPTCTNSDVENNADLTVLEETNMSDENSICCNDETKREVSLYASKQLVHSNTLQTNCK